MGGGLLQLVAYGAQDVYLTGNPQITFFKVVYRRHTNFSIESIQQTFNGNAELGNRVTCQISRNGDLVHKLYLQVSATLENGQTVFLQPFFGYKMIKHLELEIGGQRIDKQYGEWMYIWNELTMDFGKKEGYYQMVGGNKSNAPIKYVTDNQISLYIPLEFWFCRNIGLALPLIALQYHEVKVNIEFNKFDDIKATNTADKHWDLSVTPNVLASTLVGDSSAVTKFKTFSATLWADYIFLDTDERKRFAQLSHEYLIEQLQFTGEESITANNAKSVRLSFNHPCKEIIWITKPTPATTGLTGAINWTNFTNESNNNSLTTDSTLTKTAKLQLNGNDRFAEREGEYFSLVQPYQHHTNIPSNRGINVYSFALKPEEHQPSGTLNMSRIDTAQLQLLSKKSGNVFIYAVNYNVLRILSGMGGLAYSN
jgi:hypothetical protein